MTTILKVIILVCAFINVFSLGFTLGTEKGKKENE